MQYTCHIPEERELVPVGGVDDVGVAEEVPMTLVMIQHDFGRERQVRES
jgi:hypothetical protein